MLLRHRPLRVALFAVLLLTAGVLALLVFGPKPSNDRDWTPDQERLAWADFAGRRVEVHNVRNARYRSADDYDIAWEDRSYDLDRLRSAWFVVEPFESQDWEGPAHTLMSFGFAGDDYVAISVEIRKERGEAFSPWKGLLRQYEVMYPGCCKICLTQVESGSLFECVPVMQQLFLDGRIRAHGEGEPTLGLNEAPCPVDQLEAQSFEPFELPKRRTLGRGFPACLMGGHLQVAIEIVSEDG